MGVYVVNKLTSNFTSCLKCPNKQVLCVSVVNGYCKPLKGCI